MRRAWAAEYGVICLAGVSTFFTIDGADQPMFWPPDNLREALAPSGAHLSRSNAGLIWLAVLSTWDLPGDHHSGKTSCFSKCDPHNNF